MSTQVSYLMNGTQGEWQSISDVVVEHGTVSNVPGPRGNRTGPRRRRGDNARL